MQKSRDMVVTIMYKAHEGSVSVLNHFKGKYQVPITYKKLGDKDLTIEEDSDDYNAFDYEDQNV
jgi:hypothetical protein